MYVNEDLTCWSRWGHWLSGNFFFFCFCFCLFILFFAPLQNFFYYNTECPKLLKILLDSCPVDINLMDNSKNYWTENNTYQTNSVASVRQNLGEPSNVVYSFVLGIKWKLRMSRFRICMMPPWHPWAFCAIQDGVQDGRQFKQTSITPPLFSIERWIWCQTLCF
jgi:hypothetical protein